ncbi:unnamed protein product [Phyllotreta striolata]|uniref:EB domain-containing protein n=1 Tax=Phyllotreta striolata TaxID=444603 RepID=A0A9N9TI04_PHYSR|nr:unnamed protein product [Phyllotreta striolata]
MFLKFIIVCVSLIDVLGFRGALGLNEICSHNSDCFGNAICDNKKCTCDLISFPYNNNCLPYVTEYNGYCEQSSQCEWLGDNAICSRNVCTCEENFRWYQGKCMKYARKGEDCTDMDCYDNNDPLSLTCDESKKCNCSSGYYDRKYDCRKTSSEGNRCAIDMDCIGENLICDIGKCVKKNKAFSLNYVQYESEIFDDEPKDDFLPNLQHSVPIINCTYDKDCVNIKNSLCHEETKTCMCRTGNMYISGNCLPGFGRCDKKTCTEKNTDCFHNLCVCKKGYFVRNGKCIPELGMEDPALIDTTACVIKPAQWVKEKNACYCLNYWFPDEANRNCIKTTLQNTLSCLTNDWCNALGPNSFCNSTNKNCQCGKGAINQTIFYCEEKESKETCSRDNDCKYNEQCQDQICVCKENFTRDNRGKCQPDLNGSCLIQECSNIKFSSCVNGVCKCNEEYISHNNKECLTVAKTLNDTCEITEQCQNFKFTECKKSKCNCKEQYSMVDDKCWQNKKYGDPCMNELECTKTLNKDYQCQNSKCVCPIGKKLDDGYCVASSSNNIIYSSFVFVTSWILIRVLLL